MKVSIITPSFNSKDSIEDTIISVLSQDYSDIEYIIIDGKSTDGTLDIVKKYENKINKLISEPDNGIYDAMNKGISLATGEIIGILNSDDLYYSENVISKVVDVFNKHKVDCCWGNLLYFDNKKEDKIVRRWRSSNYEKGLFEKGWQIPHPTFFVKKEIYEKYGTYNPSFKITGDYELILRFLEKKKIKSFFIPEFLVKMRLGGASNKNIFNIIRGNIECYKAWKINGLETNPLKLFFKPFSKIKQYF